MAAADVSECFVAWLARLHRHHTHYTDIEKVDEIYRNFVSTATPVWPEEKFNFSNYFFVT